MPITGQIKTTPEPVNRVYLTRPAPVSKDKIKADLAALTAAGRITERDEELFEYLRDLHVLSLDQVHRLLWPGGSVRTSYNRLGRLTAYNLLGRARVPRKEMDDWGLAGRKVVYSLGPAGWIYLKNDLNPRLMAGSLRREEVLHDLLAAEIFVRLLEAAAARGPEWSVTVVGPEAASFTAGQAGEEQTAAVLQPDGLASVACLQGEVTAYLPLFIEVDKGREAHARPSSDWGRKIINYGRFYRSEWRLHPQLSDLPEFPAVLVVTHGAQRLQHLAQSILKHRRDPVVYYLGLWADLITAGPDLFAAPIWAMITGEGELTGNLPGQRQALL